MKIVFFATSLLLGGLLSLQALTSQEEIASKVPMARSILEAWKKGDPTDVNRTLHIIYWTPADREPAPQYRERLTRCMTHIQKFYEAEMKRLGFGKQTINLVLDHDKLLKIHLVKAPKPYADYRPSDGRKIRQECLPVLKKAGINADKETETIVIFCNMSNWDAKKMRITQNSPYYARGNHRGGTAWQVDSPLLDPIHLDKKEPKVHDGQYGHISIGKYNSIFVGGVAHELGHALGLPHNCERADERAAHGIALMGAGNRTYSRDLRGEGKGSFLTLASGLRLASHPMFTGSVKGMELRGRANLTDIEITKSNKSLSITGKAVIAPGSPPVYAILAYTDPNGSSNYDATTATAIPDAHGNFTLHCTDLKRQGLASLRLIALYSNGDATSHIGTASPYTYSYKVTRDGQPDITNINLTSQFQPVAQALGQRDSQAIFKALQAITQTKDPKASAIAKRLMRSNPLYPAPALIEDSVKSAALADTTPAKERLGYGMPAYNRLPLSQPGDTPLLRSGGEIFASGIYAHAPAQHNYQLGGKWTKLTGTCGLAQGTGGSVVFIIKSDTKQLWKSPLCHPGQLYHYDLNITNQQKLELIVEDGGNGNASDWGLWLEPMLTR